MVCRKRMAKLCTERMTGTTYARKPEPEAHHLLQFVFLISHILHSFLVLCELHNFWDSAKPWCILGIVSVPLAHGYNARMKENKIPPRIAHTPNKREIFSENAIISLVYCEYFDMILDNETEMETPTQTPPARPRTRNPETSSDGVYFIA